jgi:hypothetical protein
LGGELPVVFDVDFVRDGHSYPALGPPA